MGHSDECGEAGVVSGKRKEPYTSYYHIGHPHGHASGGAIPATLLTTEIGDTPGAQNGKSHWRATLCSR